MSSGKISKKFILTQSSPLLELGKYTFVKPLGKGGQATVIHIRIPNMGEFALKIYYLEQSMDDPNNEKELLQALNDVYLEYSLLNQNLPNVVRSYIYHFDENTKEFCFTMPLMKGGDLLTLIKKKGKMLYEPFLKLFQEVVTGLFKFFYLF